VSGVVTTSAGGIGDGFSSAWKHGKHFWRDSSKGAFTSSKSHTRQLVLLHDGRNLCFIRLWLLSTLAFVETNFGLFDINMIN